MKRIEDAVNCVKSQIPHYSGSLGIITGSGWELRDLLNNVTEIEYKDIPGFPVPSVGGHRGRLIHGSHNGTEVILLQGRVHYYEGYSMTDAYDKQLAGIALSSAEKHGIMLHTGSLAAVSGPSYETPAEIRMLSTLGADAVCMSTVPEVIMSRYLGMRVLAVSMITNHAAGISTSALRHEDVVNMAKSRSKDASKIISAVIDQMPR